MHDAYLAPYHPERWLEQLFGSRTAVQGGVVRRRIRDIERLIGIERFKYEVERRGFTALTNAGHMIIFCNQERIERL